MTGITQRSARRVQAALAEAGSTARVIELAATARTAGDAAQACGVEVGAIVKSLIFEIGDVPVLALIASDRRCVERALPAALGLAGRVRRADAVKVREATGFAVGGVAPLGHPAPLPAAIDVSLRRFERLFAAAGHPYHVFETSFAELCRLTGALPSEAIAEPMPAD